MGKKAKANKIKKIKQPLHSCQKQTKKENHKPNALGENEKKTNFLCATFREKEGN